MPRHDDTREIAGNFNAMDDAFYCHLNPVTGLEECCVNDCSSGEPSSEQLALTCGYQHLAVLFKDTFDNAKVLERALNSRSSSVCLASVSWCAVGPCPSGSGGGQAGLRVSPEGSVNPLGNGLPGRRGRGSAVLTAIVCCALLRWSDFRDYLNENS